MQDDMIRGMPLGPRVTAVSPMEDYQLALTFTNGERRIFDAKPLLAFKVFKPLRNKGFFSLVKVDHGMVLWPNDIDYCPDTLYTQSKPLDEQP